MDWLGEHMASRSGALLGARVEPRGPVPLPEEIFNEVEVVVPKGVQKGSTFNVSLGGVTRTIKAHVRPGERQRMKLRDTSSIVASTLHAAPPGFRIELQMPIIWATFCAQINGTSAERRAERAALCTGPLLLQVQSKLLEQAGAANCNAVLGCSYAIRTEQPAEWGLELPQMVRA
jgi:hypothetical protein